MPAQPHDASLVWTAWGALSVPRKYLGEPLVAAHACKKHVRYRYYVSRSLQHDPDRPSAEGLRIPALEIEAAVIQGIADALDDPLTLLTRAGIPLESASLRIIFNKAKHLASAVRAKQRDAIRDVVAKVIAARGTISVELSVAALCKALAIDLAPNAPPAITITSPVRLTRTGRAVQLVQRDGRPVTQGKPDPGQDK